MCVYKISIYKCISLSSFIYFLFSNEFMTTNPYIYDHIYIHVLFFYRFKYKPIPKKLLK